MNIVQEEERRVARKAPKPAKLRRTRVRSIPRWAYVLFAVLAVLVLLRTFQRGVGTLKPAQAPVRPVTVAKVVTKDVPLYLDEIGTCAAYETVLVQAQVSGVIITRNFQDGSDVKKGDLLFTIDPRPFQAALDQAKAQAELDQVNLKRQEDLRARKVVSQQDYDTAVANAQKSQAATEAAQVNLDWCYIKSPINGRVGLRNVDVGNLVGPSTPPLVTIQAWIRFTPISLWLRTIFRWCENISAGQISKCKLTCRMVQSCHAPGIFTSLTTQCSPAPEL